MPLPLLALMPLVAGGGYIANDFTGWVGKDDGTPPPSPSNTILPSANNHFVNVVIIGAVGFAGVYAYKKIKKA